MDSLTIYKQELYKLVVGTKLICTKSSDEAYYLIGEVYEIKKASFEKVSLEDEYSKSGLQKEVRDHEDHLWDKAVLSDLDWSCQFEVLSY